MFFSVCVLLFFFSDVCFCLFVSDIFHEIIASSVAKKNLIDSF